MRSNKHPTYYFANVNYLEMYDITIRNYNASSQTLSPLIVPNIAPAVSLIIEGLTIVNSNLMSSGFLKNTGGYESCVIKDLQFTDVQVATNSYIISVDSAKDIQMSNLTFNNVSSSDPNDESSTIILLPSIDMSSTVETFTIKVIDIS